jgi:hypothetical protein
MRLADPAVVPVRTRLAFMSRDRDAEHDSVLEIHPAVDADIVRPLSDGENGPGDEENHGEDHAFSAPLSARRQL